MGGHHVRHTELPAEIDVLFSSSSFNHGAPVRDAHTMPGIINLPLRSICSSPSRPSSTVLRSTMRPDWMRRSAGSTKGGSNVTSVADFRRYDIGTRRDNYSGLVGGSGKSAGHGLS